MLHCRQWLHQLQHNGGPTFSAFCWGKRALWYLCILFSQVLQVVVCRVEIKCLRIGGGCLIHWWIHQLDVFEPYWKTWVCCLALVPDSSFLTMHTPRGHSHGRLGLNHGAKGKLFSAGTAKLKVDIGGEMWQGRELLQKEHRTVESKQVLLVSSGAWFQLCLGLGWPLNFQVLWANRFYPAMACQS